MANVSFTGTVTNEPELRFTPSGEAVLNFNTAENHNRKNQQSGEWQQEGTTWRRVAVFGKRAETLAEVLEKGNLVALQGTEKSREYENRDGEKRTSFEMNANVVGIVPKAPKSDGGGFARGGYTGGGNRGGGAADPWSGPNSGSYGFSEQAEEPPF